ncbi:MAG TPA: hypothetical protein DET40_06955 [Lentisphaeria bacterium]|nr:MAG: hypothetical protein A2X45_07345 [Lentisphaerae bacterium GWF2_50_93]HCE43269.1 hypothetical protein [Lentisphaeria bacterium]
MDRINIQKESGGISISTCSFKVVLSANLGGFPSFIGFSDEEPVHRSKTPAMSASLGGKKIFPFINGRMNAEITNDPAKGKAIVNIHGIGWKYESGEILKNYRCALQYEFYHDGVAFVKTFFHTETLEPAKLADFNLELGVELEQDHECEWAFWQLPGKSVVAADIQTLGACFERLIPKGDSRIWKNRILPFFAFDFGKGNRRDKHIEFFVECWNSLGCDPRNTETEIKWDKYKAAVRWNFQKKETFTEGRACQWRNTWGWTIRQFPKERPRMPLRIYHYIDMLKHYPTDWQIRAIAAEGANLLIVHEGWRLDVKQGEFPYNHKEMKRVSKSCKKHGLRLALYVRGNEDQILEDSGESLRPYLKYNFDGVYMDYGGAWSFITNEDENAPGGRLKMRLYDLKMRRVREFVGPDGIFISHTGSFLSAAGQTSCDLYLGGEQEKGRLLENRSIHSYFSGLSICPSSLWTAAFPTYRTRAMLPFLASTAQSPFLHLGCQFPTSSLNHPQVPQAVNFVRPLWRLWRLFDGQGKVSAFSDQNTPAEVFRLKSRNTGTCAFVNRKGEMLLIASNFSSDKNNISLAPDFSKLGAENNDYCIRLGPEAIPKPDFYNPEKRSKLLSAETIGHGLSAWLFTSEPGKWKGRLEDFSAPYPGEGKEGAALRKSIQDEISRRRNPPAWKEAYIRAWVPNFVNTYEDSIWWDLYENTIELVDLSGRKERLLGFLSSEGLVKDAPDPEHYLWPGVVTPWIAVHRIPGMKGRKKLAFRTRRGKFEFYSWICVELSDQKELTEKTYRLEFNNEIDLDWSKLEFDVVIK